MTKLNIRVRKRPQTSLPVPFSKRSFLKDLHLLHTLYKIWNEEELRPDDNDMEDLKEFLRSIRNSPKYASASVARFAQDLIVELIYYESKWVKWDLKREWKQRKCILEQMRYIESNISSFIGY